MDTELTLANVPKWRWQMNIDEILVRAKQEVERANLPEALQAVAFGKVVDLLSGAGKGSQEKAKLQGSTTAGELVQGSPLERIAAKFNLDLDVVDQVLSADAESVHLIVAPGKLASSKTEGTQQIALLIAAGRQAAGLDQEWTSLNDIRGVAEEFKKYDGPNFAKHIRRMENDFNFKGSKQKLEVKVARPGWESAKALIVQLSGANA
jgi:hypothetical protein